MILKTLWFIFYIEIILLLRRSYEWLYPMVFFIIIISLFPFAFTPDPLFLQKYMPGCIWMTALFASLLSIQSIFSTDLEEGNIEQWLLSDLPLTFFILTKCTAQWIVTQLPLILLTPLLGLLFHLSFSTIAALTISLILGTPILTFIGSLGIALTLGLRQQGVLLGLLILPLSVPILIFSIMIIQQADAGFSIAGPLAFLAGLLVLSLTFIPWIIAVTLPISLDD